MESATDAPPLPVASGSGQDSFQSILQLHTKDQRNENGVSGSTSTNPPDVRSKDGSCNNDNEDDLKREYLKTLPLSQLIEICLTFESHVPLHVKDTIWPADLSAAVAAVKLRDDGSAHGSSRDASHSRNDHAPEGCAPALATLTSEDNTAKQTNPSQTESGTTQKLSSLPPTEAATDLLDESPSAETDQPDLIVSAQQTLQRVLQEFSRSATPLAQRKISPPPPTSSRNGAESASTEQRQPSNSQTTTQSSIPQPSTSSAPQLGYHPQVPYAYQPYGYPIPAPNARPPYPHTPYYGAPPGYGTPYSGYPYPPPPGYHPHAAASMYAARPPMTPLHPTSHPPIPTHPHPAAPTPLPPPPPPPSGDDLPSYEDMIVEALLDIGDPDGAAPRDLFNWMEARYPLQTNFRPSASQALQKAFKRGRLEKRPGGKYRIDPSWEGGATSRRTTRRPQTLAQTNYHLHQPSSSPFTTAPLTRNSRGSTVAPVATAGGQHTPYGYPYSYAYGSYPAYVGYPQTAGKASAASTAATSSSATTETTSEPVQADKATEATSAAAEHGDAWEAAQHILNVINFSSLQTQESDGSRVSGAETTSQGANGLSTLSDEHRASLQAQLALLAAQLSELAEMDEDEEPVVPQIQAPTAQVASTAAGPSAPPPAAQPAEESHTIDVNQFPEEVHRGSASADRIDPSSSSTQTQVQAPEPIEDDDDSDADMEIVEVPAMAALRA